MPISSHCFWPCDSAPASRWRRSTRRVVARMRSIVSRSAAAGPPNKVAKTPRGALAASRMLSETVWFSNTVGFWNLRPTPSSAISASSRRVKSWRPSNRLRPRRAALCRDDVHHRRLAGAVGADDRAHLARLERQRQAAQRLVAVEGNADAVEVEQRGGEFGARPLRSSRALLLLRQRRGGGWDRLGGAAAQAQQADQPLGQEQVTSTTVGRAEEPVFREARRRSVGPPPRPARRRPACRGRRPRHPDHGLDRVGGLKARRAS